MASTHKESIGRFSQKAPPQQEQIKRLSILLHIKAVMGPLTKQPCLNTKPSRNLLEIQSASVQWARGHQVVSTSFRVRQDKRVIDSWSPFLSKTTKQSYKHCSGQTIAIQQGQSNSNGDLGMALQKQTWGRDTTAFKELSVRNISFIKTCTRNRNKKNLEVKDKREIKSTEIDLRKEKSVPSKQ